MAELATLSPTHDLGHLLGALGRVPENRRRVAVDGGAHTGIWTDLMADEFEHVVAFEPHPDYADRIPPRANVEVHQVALGKTLAECGLAEGTDNEGQCRVTDGGGSWIVPLDAFALERVDFVKLDVEGFEQPALEGARRTIERCRPWVMVEQNDLAEIYYGADPDAARKRLRQWGYREVDRWNKDVLYAP